MIHKYCLFFNKVPLVILVDWREGARLLRE